MFKLFTQFSIIIICCSLKCLNFATCQEVCLIVSVLSDFLRRRLVSQKYVLFSLVNPSSWIDKSFSKFSHLNFPLNKDFSRTVHLNTKCLKQIKLLTFFCNEFILKYFRVIIPCSYLLTTIKFIKAR